MFNLFDILQAQAGANLQGFGPQFGLTQEQSLRAMEALLPALTMGLQRNAAQDPMGFAQMFKLAGASPASGAKPSPQMEMLVGQLFGSPHLSQAVLQQAAAVSGVATPALKQMLPIMAGMVVAGIVHVMLNQTPAPAAPSAPQPFGFPSNAWSEMMETFMRSGAVPFAPASNTPARKPPAPPRLTAPSKPASGATDNGTTAEAPFEVMQQMFQTGLEVQQENARAMQRLFDTFWQAPAARTDAEPSRPGTQAPGGAARTKVEPKTEQGRRGR